MLILVIVENNREEVLVQFMKDFYQICIDKKKLTDALTALLYQDFTYLSNSSTKDAQLFHLIFKNLGHPDSIFAHSITALAQSFTEGQDKILLKVLREINDKRGILMPGIVFHIGLGILLSQGGLQLRNHGTAKEFLRLALIDIIEDPRFPRMFSLYEKIASGLVRDDSISMDDKRKWGEVETALTCLQTADTELLRSAILSFLMINMEFSVREKGKPLNSTMDAYLATHPRMLNSVITEAFAKNFYIAEKFKAIPIYWHLAFYDRWEHEGRPIPKKLPHTMKWLEPLERNTFITFCMSRKNGYSYFKHLEPFSLSTFFISHVKRFEELDKKQQVSRLKPMRLIRTFLGREKFSHKPVLRLLEMIDTMRDVFFSDTYTHLLKEPLTLFTENFLRYYSLLGIYENNFFNLDKALDDRFQSLSARRTSYLILLHHKLKNCNEQSFQSLVDIMRYGFYKEKYQYTPEDILSLLNAMNQEEFRDLLKKLPGISLRHEELLRTFTYYYIDLLANVYTKTDAKEKEYAAQFAYFYLRGLLGHEVARLIEAKLQTMGIHVPLLYNGIVAIFSHHEQPDFKDHIGQNLRDKNTYQKPEDTNLLAQWQMEIISRLERLVEARLSASGYIPILYHPAHGYGIVLTGLTSVLVFCEHQLPHEFSPYLKHDLFGNLSVPICENPNSPQFSKLEKEIKHHLKDTFLEGSDIEFIPVNALHVSENDGLRILIKRQDSRPRTYPRREYYLLH